MEVVGDCCSPSRFTSELILELACLELAEETKIQPFLLVALSSQASYHAVWMKWLRKPFLEEIPQTSTIFRTLDGIRIIDPSKKNLEK